MTAKKLPTEVTLLDALKTFAVIIMIIDHVGLYFFSDEEWFRAIGRVGMPIWFFMAGYALSRDLPNKLLIGALILSVCDFVLFQRTFPFNALATIILIRMLIDPMMNFITRSRYIFVIGCVLLVLFYVATNMVFEYGTLAFLFAVMGYLVRHRDKVMKLTFMRKYDYYFVYAITFFGFCLLQNAQFGFNDIQFIVMMFVTAIVMGILINLKPMTFPQIKGQPQKQFLQFCGRRTLEIYVVHLVVFKVILFVGLGLN
jgi:peptidoglycan/LPS O-acetylase OafA/YrhL